MLFHIQSINVYYANYATPETPYLLKYKWLFRDKNATGESSVYVRNRDKGYILLSYWNRQGNWLYYPVD